MDGDEPIGVGGAAGPALFRIQQHLRCNVAVFLNKKKISKSQLQLVTKKKKRKRKKGTQPFVGTALTERLFNARPSFVFFFVLPAAASGGPCSGRVGSRCIRRDGRRPTERINPSINHAAVARCTADRWPHCRPSITRPPLPNIKPERRAKKKNKGPH